MAKLLTYKEFTGSEERTPEKIAAYTAYLKENNQKNWNSK